ncbi:MAG: hypothetical protein ACYDH9_16480 [Limisphaerales bacterium]
MIASIDMNIWGLLAMPTGLVICFGPALLSWLNEELRDQPPEEPTEKR